jgi:hypothetical protein
VVIELDRPYTVRGQVRDRNGQPLVGAKVWFDQAPGQARLTDEQGRFAFENLGHLSGLGAIQAHFPGWLPASKELRASDGRTQEVTLVLGYRGGAVSGQVVRAGAHQPILNAVVIAQGPDPPGLSRLWFLPEFELEEVWQDPEAWPWGNLRDTRHAVTDEQGRFTLPELPEGDYTLYVVGPTIDSMRHEGVVVVEGKTTENVVLEAFPEGDTSFQPIRPRRWRVEPVRFTFAGRLLNPDGTPASRVKAWLNFRVRWLSPGVGDPGESQIYARWTDDPRWHLCEDGVTHLTLIQTDGDGTFALEYDRSNSCVRLIISPPTDSEPIADLALGVEGFKPVFWKNLRMNPDRAAEHLEARLEAGQSGRLSTNSQGRFELRDVPPGVNVEK